MKANKVTMSTTLDGYIILRCVRCNAALFEAPSRTHLGNLVAVAERIEHRCSPSPAPAPKGRP